jgi:hypothetical protein
MLLEDLFGRQWYGAHKINRKRLERIPLRTMCAPQDVVKQRLQVQRNNEAIRYRNSFHGVTTIFREEGIRGLYRVRTWCHCTRFDPNFKISCLV